MQLPNGPKTPRWLRMVKLTTRPLDYLEDYYQRYGDFIWIGGGARPAIYLCHPEAVQAVFNAPPGQFQMNRGGGQVLEMLLGDYSLLLLDGDRHQRQRKLLMPPFQGERLRTYSQLIVQITQTVMAQTPQNTPVPVRAVTQDITLNVILNLVFGLNQGQRYDQLKKLLSTLLDLIGSPLGAALIFFPQLQKDWGGWSPWGQFIRQKQQVDTLIYQEIQERRQQPESSGNDILSLLLAARDEAGQPMTPQELRDELITLLVAGHETTASALAWGIYWVNHLPEVGEKLRQEWVRLDGSSDLEAINRLPYLTAVCQEILRIYPIALMTGVRRLTAPLQVMQYQFEAGTVLFPSVYLVHQRQDLYPNPKQFRPERFLERQFSPAEYLPFGGGHRRCIGSALAMMEMKLVLATLFTHWNLSLTDSRPLKPVRRGLTIAPPSSLKMVVQARTEVISNLMG
ncbi:MAG: cytochrome P450 [Oscillatoriales cyanobacterium RM2_1_1]|nr:cytochrome P450 [Oscillatoriales cyanobacterium SM2_3_0]NJO45193.1 cytochrome P450 [Oscillatoriales cyanobacterium RM2_1_1]